MEFKRDEKQSSFQWYMFFYWWGGRHIRDRMVIGFTTTYVISAYHHWCWGFESRSGWGVQHHVIKFVSDLRQVECSPGPPVSSTNKPDRHDITELNQANLSVISQKRICVHILNNFTWNFIHPWSVHLYHLCPLSHPRYDFLSAWTLLHAHILVPLHRFLKSKSSFCTSLMFSRPRLQK